jgi:single-stranded-DNA-specific exonuclease
MVPPVWEHAAADHATVGRLAAALGLDPVIARLLVIRGLTDPDQASRFLNPSLDHLHDPALMAGLPEAVARIERAVAAGERVAIHGDYDVDGITSTVILRRTIELIGGNVGHFIPDRIKDGYGLQPETIDRLHAEGTRLLISVDCGIRGEDAARRALELGVDLIITDHHEPGAALPPAVAVVNPKRRDCAYPEKNLAGVGVALKVVQALCAAHGHERWLPAFLKIAAIGTLADVVPLVGENRVIAKLGLDLLSRGPHKVGLRALIEAAGLTGRRIESSDVSFGLAPRMNAAGRMSTPDIAARLLLASDDALAEEARDLAEQLNVENARRQQEEAATVAEARRLVESDPDIGARTVLVVGGRGWHRGVIGIVASKLVESFHRPAIVLSIDDDVAHGSCRSIPSFDMLAALESAADVMVRFGGHKVAAGLVVESDRIRELRARVNAFADERLGPDDLRPRLRIDDHLSFRQLTGPVAAQVVALAPFGIGNPRPVFSASGVEIADGPRRLKERHLKMALRQGGRVMRAIAWRGVERHAFLEGHRDSVDVAYSLSQNEFNGETYLELTVADIRPADVGAPAAVRPAPAAEPVA